jgi:hypothetical protein
LKQPNFCGHLYLPSFVHYGFWQPHVITTRYVMVFWDTAVLMENTDAVHLPPFHTARDCFQDPDNAKVLAGIRVRLTKQVSKSCLFALSDINLQFIITG